MFKPLTCQLVPTSYSDEDVIVLLKDLTGKIEALDTEEREKLNQSGKHYSEMLPVEYKPTQEYLDIFNEILDINKDKLARSVSELGNKIVEKYKNKKCIYLVSFARAGTPIGILLKRYIEDNYDIKIEHYSISIIRGKGIDMNAMKFICSEAGYSPILFIDGWIGKGAIQKELDKSLEDYWKIREIEDSIIDPKLYSISDPGFINDYNHCGTREDFMMPNACLNATVNGLFSRSIRNELINENDFDGAVYYPDLETEDLSNKFLNVITDKMNELALITNIDKDKVLERIMKDYNVKDINKVKPGIGETIRVLLRRIPDKVLIQFNQIHSKEMEPIKELCLEKRIQFEVIYDDGYLGNYKCVGIIKEVSDL